MFVEAVVLLAAIIGILLALSAFVFHMITRKDKTETDENIEKMVDAAVDVALEEVMRTSQLVLDELNEKYKALLFMYQLMDDKHKELEDKAVEVEAASSEQVFSEELIPEEVPSEPEIKVIEQFHEPPAEIEVTLEEAEAFLEEVIPEEEKGSWLDRMINEQDLNISDIIEESKTEMQALGIIHEKPKPPPKVLSAHPRYEDIRALYEIGFSIPEIAKELNMGSGEVRLIIGLSGR